MILLDDRARIIQRNVRPAGQQECDPRVRERAVFPVAVEDVPKAVTSYIANASATLEDVLRVVQPVELRGVPRLVVVIRTVGSAGNEGMCNGVAGDGGTNRDHLVAMQ